MTKGQSQCLRNTDPEGPHPAQDTTGSAAGPLPPFSTRRIGRRKTAADGPPKWRPHMKTRLHLMRLRKELEDASRPT